MRRVGAILFLLLYLAANTEVHQLLRLPVFFTHYNEHKLVNPDISLGEFFVLHYLDRQSPDFKGDQHLPFKNAKCPEVSISIALPPEILPETELEPFAVSQKVVLFKSPFATSSFLFTIWQPPRA